MTSSCPQSFVHEESIGGTSCVSLREIFFLRTSFNLLHLLLFQSARRNYNNGKFL